MGLYQNRIDFQGRVDRFDRDRVVVLKAYSDDANVVLSAVFRKSIFSIP